MFITRIFPSRPVVWLSALFALPLLALSGSTVAVAYPTGQAPTPQPTSRPILLTDPVPDPQQEGVLYFTPTGHTLRGPFLLYWQQHGGLAQFGYPLTEEFTEPLGPIAGGHNSLIVVQYFERNRFELHPENQPPSDVLLGTLSREFLPENAPTAKATPLPSPALYFPETGHNLSGQFKVYWQEHGGLAIHGYPLTEQFEERSAANGKSYLVQYFERSRMELHPENAGSPYEVLLGQLGRQLSEKRGYPYGWYPLFGHADNYSWVAGSRIPKGACFLPECNCTFGNDPSHPALSVDPLGSVYKDFLISEQVCHTNNCYGVPIVLYGHFPGPNEKYARTCIRTPYIVDRVQFNPAH